MRRIRGTSTLLLLFAGCGGESSSGEGSQVETDPSRLEERMDRTEVDLPVIPVSDADSDRKLSVSGSRVRLTQVAEVAPPSLPGTSLQASSISIRGPHAFVSYHAAGSGRGGAVDVFDVSDPSFPILVSSWTVADQDINAVGADADRMYLAVSGDDLGFDATSAVRSLEVSSGIIDETSAEIRALSSHVANSVEVTGGELWATTGSEGHVYRLDPVDLAVLGSAPVNDARSVARSGDRIVVHAGSGLRVFDAATWSLESEYALDHGDDDEARSEVVTSGGKALATAGSSGVHILSLDDGTLHQTLAVPAASELNLSAGEAVANGLGLDGAYLFIAQGGAGLFLVRANRAPSRLTASEHSRFEGLSRIVIDGASSANAVAVAGDVLFVAAGRGGLRIVRVEELVEFVDVSAATGFDLRTTRSGSGLDGIGWADLDGDGDQDAILAGRYARVMLNEGGSSFVETPLGNHERSVSLLDADDDGDVDFATSWDTSIFVNDGSGRFTRERPPELVVLNNEEGMAAYDHDRDGRGDLFVFCQNGNWVATRTATAVRFDVSTGYGLDGPGSVLNGSYVATGDLDDDGRVDFVYDRDTLDPRVFVASSPSSWTVLASSPSNRPVDKVGLVFGDIDNDDDLDLFVGGRGDSHGIRLWRNDSGQLVNATTSAGLDDALGTHTADLGDYDNDGDLDLVFSSTSAQGRIRLARNDGRGFFTTGTLDVRATHAPSALSFVDYDDDGDLDLSVVVESGDNILLRNLVDDDRSLSVRVRGRGVGAVDRLALGTTVRLFAEDGLTFVARREVGAQRGPNSGPLRIHFGGVDPERPYVVKVDFHTGTVTTTVTPSQVSSTVGARVITGLLTVEEP